MRAVIARGLAACLWLAAMAAGAVPREDPAMVAEAHAPPAAVVLPERSELLPEAFDPASLLGALPAGVGLVDARLYRVFPYGPEVYLLVLQASEEGVQVPMTLRDTLTTQLSLFPPQQRLWTLLLRLPGDRWPAQGKPELLAAVSVSPACTSDPLATGDATAESWSDAGLGDDERIEALLAPWRWLDEPVIALLRSNHLEGSGGGMHAANAWYLAMDPRRPGDVRQMLPLLCAPANAGFWSKPGYDVNGNVDEPGQEEDISWTVQPWLDPAYSSLPLLYLLEDRGEAGGACVRARYVDNGGVDVEGEGLYRLDREDSSATPKTETTAGSFRPCSSRTTAR